MKKILLMGLLTLSTSAIAGEVGDIKIFTSGTPAKASEVNDNFSAVKTAVNDNAARITQNTALINQHATVINQQTNIIDQLFNGSIATIRTTNFSTKSDFNPGNPVRSLLAAASCTTNELLVGGSCSCVTLDTDLSTTNYGLAWICEGVGNTYTGACVTPFPDVDTTKYGPSINVHAICLKAITADGEEFKTLSVEERKPDAEAQARIDQLNEQLSVIEAVNINKASAQ